MSFVFDHADDAVTKAERVALPAGIESYRVECEMVLGWIAAWLHQDDFDKRSQAYRFNAGQIAHCFGPGDYIPPRGDRLLWLLQVMASEGNLVEAKENRDGAIQYRRKLVSQ